MDVVASSALACPGQTALPLSWWFSRGGDSSLFVASCRTSCERAGEKLLEKEAFVISVYRERSLQRYFRLNVCFTFCRKDANKVRVCMKFSSFPSLQGCSCHAALRAKTVGLFINEPWGAFFSDKYSKWASDLCFCL